jgi:hypothetical protein
VIRRKRASIVQVALAQALVVLTAWLSLAPLLHGDDIACNPTIVVHDSSQHRITASADTDNTPGADDHCLACHLFRNSGGAIAWRFVPQAFDDYSLVATAAGAFLLTRAGLPLSARAPPSAT